MWQKKIELLKPNKKAIANLKITLQNITLQPSNKTKQYPVLLYKNNNKCNIPSFCTLNSETPFFIHSEKLFYLPCHKRHVRELSFKTSFRAFGTRFYDFLKLLQNPPLKSPKQKHPFLFLFRDFKIILPLLERHNFECYVDESFGIRNVLFYLAIKCCRCC